MHISASGYIGGFDTPGKHVLTFVLLRREQKLNPKVNFS